MYTFIDSYIYIYLRVCVWVAFGCMSICVCVCLCIDVCVCLCVLVWCELMGLNGLELEPRMKLHDASAISQHCTYASVLALLGWLGLRNLTLVDPLDLNP